MQETEAIIVVLYFLAILAALLAIDRALRIWLMYRDKQDRRISNTELNAHRKTVDLRRVK